MIIGPLLKFHGTRDILAWSRRYLFTQFPKVASPIPSSRATCAVGREESMTNFTASARNSGEKVLLLRVMRQSPLPGEPIYPTVRETGGRSVGGPGGRQGRVRGPGRA